MACTGHAAARRAEVSVLICSGLLAGALERPLESSATCDGAADHVDHEGDDEEHQTGGDQLRNRMRVGLREGQCDVRSDRVRVVRGEQLEGDVASPESTMATAIVSPRARRGQHGRRDDTGATEREDNLTNHLPSRRTEGERSFLLGRACAGRLRGVVLR